MDRRYLKYKQSRKYILTMMIFILYFAFVRRTIDSTGNLISLLGRTCNERIFLAVFLPIFLVNNFNMLKNIVNPSIIIRENSKWNYTFVTVKTMVLHSVIYTSIVLGNWYIMIGMSGIEGKSRAVFIYIFYMFITQIIGWTLIGMTQIIVFLYLPNIVLSFIFCQLLFIMTNLSLYLSLTLRDILAIRIYSFMFELSDFTNWESLLTVGLIYGVIIMSVTFICYKLLKNYDFLPRR